MPFTNETFVALWSIICIISLAQSLFIRVAPLDIIMLVLESSQMTQFWKKNNLQKSLKEFYSSEYPRAEDVQEVDVKDSSKRMSRLFIYGCAHYLKTGVYDLAIDRLASDQNDPKIVTFHNNLYLDTCLKTLTEDMILPKLTPGTGAYTTRLLIDTVVLVLGHDEVTAGREGATSILQNNAFIFYLYPPQMKNHTDFATRRRMLAENFANGSEEFVIPYNHTSPGHTWIHIYAVLCGFNIQCAQQIPTTLCYWKFARLPNYNCRKKPSNVKCPNTTAEEEEIAYVLAVGSCTCPSSTTVFTVPMGDETTVVQTSTTVRLTTTQPLNKMLFAVVGTCFGIMVVAVITTVLVFLSVRRRRQRGRGQKRKKDRGGSPKMRGKTVGKAKGKRLKPRR